MISTRLRKFSYALAAMYFALGLVLFLAPHWASENFAWRISPFVAMTIGGWSLGTSWACFTVAKRAHWGALFATIIYISLFGVFETGVVVLFRARLLLQSPLAWFYLVTLVATCLFALIAVVEGAGLRRMNLRFGPRFGTGTITLVVIFVLLVGFLGLYGLTAVQGMRGLNAGIFPEILSPFSLRAFGSFYFVLAIGAVSLLITRGIGNLVSYAYSMYGLIVFITLAAFVFIGKFDFVNRPAQLTYIGIYLAVGLVTGIYMLRNGIGSRMQDEVARKAMQ